LRTAQARNRCALVIAGTALAGTTLVLATPSANATPAEGVAVQATSASAPCTDRHVIFTVDGTPYHGFDYSKTLTTVISKGSQGNVVKEAQCLLEDAKCAPGTVDGIFGDKTRAATIRFQEKNGLNTDGSIGPKTWPKLRALYPKNC
jgi:peptidoglycan hydrolase-like protein with peptidoglycan-binding domain